jgi:hypothetical protein
VAVVQLSGEASRVQPRNFQGDTVEVVACPGWGPLKKPNFIFLQNMICNMFFGSSY